MTKIALMGAGGKMGVRLSKNLIGSPYEVDHIEISEEGRQRLANEAGLQSTASTDRIGEADVVLLAVPDRMIGKISHSIIDDVKPGAALVVLDAAAPYAGEMPERDDVTYFCSHPCHPSIFDFTPDEAVQRDFFGGIDAPQGIVCALIQGPESHLRCVKTLPKRYTGRSHVRIDARWNRSPFWNRPCRNPLGRRCAWPCAKPLIGQRPWVCPKTRRMTSFWVT
jgi:hypothetical protein